jgi:hypothetical protein
MIRDPSDGSVKPDFDDRMEREEARQIGRQAIRSIGIETRPVIDTTTSGLPTGSSKPENIARLEKSREWLKGYFHRKTEGT